MIIPEINLIFDWIFNSTFDLIFTEVPCPAVPGGMRPCVQNVGPRGVDEKSGGHVGSATEVAFIRDTQEPCVQYLARLDPVVQRQSHTPWNREASVWSFWREGYAPQNAKSQGEHLSACFCTTSRERPRTGINVWMHFRSLQSASCQSRIALDPTSKSNCPTLQRSLSSRSLTTRSCAVDRITQCVTIQRSNNRNPKYSIYWIFNFTEDSALW